MKIYSKITVIGIIAGLFYLCVIVIISDETKRAHEIRSNKERIKFLKDSLEMEYYKKQLESYPFEHSKIPTDGK